MGDKKDISLMPTIIFITGAGQGFGRACALSASLMFKTECVMLLCGRHLESLNETCSLVKDKNPSVILETFVLDLLDVNENELYKTLEEVLIAGKYKFDNFIIIHNAGSVGDVTKFSYEFSNADYMRSYFQVNVVGTIALNSVLLRRVSEISGDHKPSIFVVNVSSLAAIKPFPSMSLYSASKAAREIFFQCLSDEWRSQHSQPLWVINYAPGPMKTDMLRKVNQDTVDLSTKTYLDELWSSGNVLDPFHSSEKLFHNVLIRHESIESGSRLDVYDV